VLLVEGAGAVPLVDGAGAEPLVEEAGAVLLVTGAGVVLLVKGGVALLPTGAAVLVTGAGLEALAVGRGAELAAGAVVATFGVPVLATGATGPVLDAVGTTESTIPSRSLVALQAAAAARLPRIEMDATRSLVLLFIRGPLSVLGSWTML
jgi:hypothetical protein